MRRYDSYKDSGVEWIGEIPSNWHVKRLKYFCVMVIEKGFPKKGEIKISPENVESDTGVCFNLYSEYSGEGAKFTVGDILLNKLRLYLKKILFTEYEGYSMGEMIVLRVFDGVKRFYSLTFFHQGLIDELDNQSTGVKLPRVSPEIILNTKFPVPPLSEQHQIVSYLDRKTAQIDYLIEKSQRKIELLKENRISLINEVVTKGLNPDVEMKDSGVEWIGEIPSGWILKPLKHIVKNLNSGTSVNSEDTPVNGIDEFGVLKTSCVFGDTFRPEENKKVVIDEYDRVKCPVIKDSIVFSRMNTPDLVGSNGYVEKDFGNLFLPDRLWITEFFEDIQLSVKWLSFVTISRRFRSELSSRSTGTSPSMKNITKDDLLTIKTPYPSFSEQLQIVSYLDEHTQLIDKTVSVEERRIELLKAYRQSLISEVVTGKRKVTTDE